MMSRLATPRVPVSWGELLDKVTILEIKRERIAELRALDNVEHELEQLWRAAAEAIGNEALIGPLSALKAVNERLWDIEDAIRREGARERFGNEFIALARSVYVENDRRAELKRHINLLLGSELVEEKSYWNAAPEHRRGDQEVMSELNINQPAA
jgi:hypothetical protein